jgi:hypothetical protein
MSCALASLPTEMQASNVARTSCLSSDIPATNFLFLGISSRSWGVSTMMRDGVSPGIVRGCPNAEKRENSPVAVGTPSGISTTLDAVECDRARGDALEEHFVGETGLELEVCSH